MKETKVYPNKDVTARTVVVRITERKEVREPAKKPQSGLFHYAKSDRRYTFDDNGGGYLGL